MRALLMIDVQNGFLDPKQPIRNNKDAESNMLRLMEHCRQKEDFFHFDVGQDTPAF